MTCYLDWASDMPGTWVIRPLRAVADYTVSNVDKLAMDGEFPVRLCNYTDVYNNEYITPGLDLMRATATRAEIDKFSLEIGDVVITKDSESWDDIGVPSFVKETAKDLVCGYHLAILRPDTGILDGNFLFRCLQSKPVRVQLELTANGITRFGVSKSDIGRILLPIPPLSDQLAVVRYLDREVARLDSLITAKLHLLRLIVEKRQALIANAVTRGLDQDSPLRESGVPWLGRIPAHWQVERTRWLFQERDERSETGEEELLSVSHLTGVTPRSEKDVNMFEAETTEGYKICLMGDLVINTLWAWMGAMGISPVNGIVSPAYNVYRPGLRLYPGYVDALVRIPAFAQEATRYSKGVWSSRLRLYPEGFFEILFPVPPIEEQRSIAAHICTQTSKLDALRLATERTIELLKERRSVLIAAVVTGQLEVT